MKSVGEGAQMLPQEVEGHFDRQKLVLLIRLARCGQGFITTPVKSDRKRRKFGFAIVEGDSAVALAIQADLESAGMKTFSPIEFLRHGKIMPFEAQARLANAAMQRAPA